MHIIGPSYSFGYNRGNERTERWSFVVDGIHKSVEIKFNLDWFSREGSNEDLKQLAIKQLEKENDNENSQ